MDNKQKEIEDIENSIDENEEEEEDSEQNEQEKKTSEKDVDKRNSEEENAAEELFIPHVEKNKDFFLMQDDNGYQSDSSSDSGEIDAKEEESLTRHILNQLLYLKMTRNKKKQKEKRFIPSVKNFLRLDFEKKLIK